LAYSPEAPAPTSDGVLGMQRITARPPPSQSSRVSAVSPAATETISGLRACTASRRAVQTSRMICGLTARTTTSALATAASLSVLVWMP